MAEYNNHSEYEELDLNGSFGYESFVDPPVGEYEGIIDHYEFGKCTLDVPLNGKDMITIYINVTVGDQETQLRDNIILVHKWAWKLRELFVGTGQMKKEEKVITDAMKKIKEMPGLRVKFSYTEGKKKRQDGTPYKNIKYHEKKPAATGAGWNGGF